jgi:dTDP-4-dehydrorhamnose reductase
MTENVTKWPFKDACLKYNLNVSALIGHTGFVGGHLQTKIPFQETYNRSNISNIQGLKTDLLICAGLPAEKWKANSDPNSDWLNMANLSQLISTVKADKAILVSTIDVYQPAIDINEDSQPNFIGTEAYGRNRAWFEMFFKATFPNSLIVRLPGLFAPNLKKNLIFDLINKREDQYNNVDGESKFQFFDITQISKIIETALENQLSTLNIATEPVFAQEIADIFKVQLSTGKKKLDYQMKSNHDSLFGGENGYLFSKEETIQGISDLQAMGI